MTTQTAETTLALLTTYGIPIAEWGTGNAKTLGHLVDEIDAGESRLEVRGGQLVRVTASVSVMVRFGILRLKETKQVFRDGRARTRNINGIGEKLKPGEHPMVAMRRALQEELKLDPDLVSVSRDRSGAPGEPEESKSYPGLLSSYTIHKFEVELAPSQYNPAGYTETQADKTTYFEWVQADTH